MSINRVLHKPDLCVWGIIAYSSALLIAQPHQKMPNVIVWDTVVPLGTTLDVQNRSTWQAVPADLLRLESKYAAAVADPSYYGRAYAFRGDAVIENKHAIIACASHGGRVIVYTKKESRRQVELVKGTQRVDATDVLQIISLCALEGEQLLLEATGSDADAALEALAELFENGFDEAQFGKGQAESRGEKNDSVGDSSDAAAPGDSPGP